MQAQMCCSCALYTIKWPVRVATRILSGALPPLPPTADLFWSGPESARYEAFLRRTKELGETTTIEQHVAKPWRRPASKLGQRLFIEGRE